MDAVDVFGAVDVVIAVELVAVIVVEPVAVIVVDVGAVIDVVVDLAQALNIKVATNMKLNAM